MPEEVPALPEEPTTVHSLPEAKEVTKARARDVWALLVRYGERYWPKPRPREGKVPQPPRVTGAHARWLPVLRMIPALLVLLFIASFFWDFPGVTTTLFGGTLAFQGLLRILAVSGLIGYLTNWLAITMLFQPREKRPIFGQGLIPAQRERVIFRLAQAVSEKLINAEIIKQRIEESGVIPRYRETAVEVARGVLEDPGFRSDLKRLASDYAREVLGSPEVRKQITDFTVKKLEESAGEGFTGIALRFYRTLNERDFQRRIDEAVTKLPDGVELMLDRMDGMLDQLPPAIEARSEALEDWATTAILSFVENIDVYEIVSKQMAAFDEAQLENLLKNTSNEQLNYIKYLGGILGAIGGFVIWQPLLSLVVLGVLGGSLWGLDMALFRSAPPSRT